MKWGECGKGLPKKNGKLIKLVLMNLTTPYDMSCLLFCTNWWSHKKDGKDYSFGVFCDLLIRDKHKFLDEGNLGGKKQARFLKGKGKNNYKDRGCVDGYGPRHECPNQKTKLKPRESSNSQKDQKKKTCHYFGKVAHLEKTYWKKRADLEEKVKKLEEDVTTMCLTSHSVDDFTFNVGTSEALLA